MENQVNQYKLICIEQWKIFLFKKLYETGLRDTGYWLG